MKYTSKHPSNSDRTQIWELLSHSLKERKVLKLSKVSLANAINPQKKYSKRWQINDI